MKPPDVKAKVLPFIVLVFIAVSTALLLILASGTKALETLELKSIDYRFIKRKKKVEISDRLKLIAIDEKSLDKLEEPLFLWPALITKVLEKLVENDAAVTGLDAIQAREIDKYMTGETRKMQQVLLSGKVVLISYIDGKGKLKRPILPYVMTAGPENIGVSNVTPDADEVIRRQAIHFSVDDVELPAFPFVLLSKYFGGEIYQGKDYIYRISDRKISDDGGRLVINYAGPADSIEMVSFYDALKKAEEEDDRWFKEKFKDKIVVIGRTDRMGKDLFAVPFTTFDKKPMTGLEIHGNVINTVLQEAYLRRASILLDYLLLMVLSLTAVMASFYLKPLRGIPLSLAAALAFIQLSLYLFSEKGLIVNATLPLLSVPLSYGFGLLYRYVTVDLKVKRIRQAFGKLVSPEVEEELWRERIEVAPGKGENRKVTVLFSDINNFTPKCEKWSAETVMEKLNEYFTEMVEIIFNNKGTIRQFVGDEIMVMYGAPANQPRQALLAVKTAVEMVDRLVALTEEKGAENGFYEVKVGIHTGEMKVGFLGSERRMEYTGIGENVNLASRIEGLNKIHKTFVLISAETYDDMMQDEKLVEEMIPGVDFIKIEEPQKMKGFEEEKTVYIVTRKNWPDGVKE